MPSFVLRSMSLLSRLEKRARRVPFHPQTTVVRGPNDTGKSSLLKSIYACFGAKPEVVNESWLKANVSGLVKFTVDGVQKAIVRDGKRYALFDDAGKLIEVHSSVMTGLAPALAKLLGFELRLVTRQNKLVVPPPAYLFLPFNIDQDKSWSEPWSGFADLAMFTGYKKILAEYHTGYKPNEFYKASGEHATVKATLKDPTSRLGMLEALLLSIEERMRVAVFDIDIDNYRKEIEELLVICDGLRKREEDLKQELVQLHGEKTQLALQTTIAKATIADLREDFKFASREMPDADISCPTCGQHYDNSFLARFSLAHDENRCEEVLVELQDDAAAVEKKLEAAREKHAAVTAEITRVNAILAAKQGDIRLKDVLESEGRKEVQRVLKEDIAAVKESISKIEKELEKLKETMESFDDKHRVKELNTEFRELMAKHLGQLSVPGMSTAKLRVWSKISETGSDLPRALLAYYYSVLHMTKDRSAAAFCTIVMDSPNQQDQDRSNYIKMLEFIRDERPKDSQLVLGLVDSLGVDFGGTLIELTDERQLLQDSQFDEVSKEMEPFFAQMLK